MTENLPAKRLIESGDVMSPTNVVEQVSLIQHVMSSVMRDGEHYGVIPGCGNKPTLLKAGAEKLALTFKLDIQTEVETLDMTGGHREYRVSATVYHAPTGNRLGRGHGCCSTMETKYRYRSENTGAEVPREYWDNRDPAILGGSSFHPRKVGGNWLIFHKVEHDNPADYYNTCLKMAEKRARVDAVLAVTAASDCFTQDVEDLRANGVVEEPDETPAAPAQPKQQAKPERKKPQKVEAKRTVEPNDTDGMTKETAIMKVTKKNGQNAKGPWTKYGIMDTDSQWYNTFSDTLGEIANIANQNGEDVILVYQQGKYGNDLLDIRSVGQVETVPAGVDGETSPFDDDTPPF